jgi:NAD(P)-dependent dehydrogenase (short-subunit alcohol dehydrogenase family)
VPRKLAEAVVVVTGASSGIGEATALAMASRGGRLVLAARDERVLGRVRDECVARGAQAIAVATDVSDEAAVGELARSGHERFGRLDVWVNNAEETPAGAFRRVLETNFFGQVHGARAALPYFRRQGSGVLINLCSVWGRSARRR